MRRQLPSASTRRPLRPPPTHMHPSHTHTHARVHTPHSPSPPLSIISIWCGQPVCVVLISSNKSVIIAVPSLLSLPLLSPPPSLCSLPLTRSSLLVLPPFPAAVFPFVQRTGVLRGAHALLRRRDCFGSRLPAFSQDCVPGPQGKQKQGEEKQAGGMEESDQIF